MTARSLAEIADFFDTLASDQTASIRWQQTKAAKRECQIKADTYHDAAELLRDTELQPCA